MLRSENAQAKNENIIPYVPDGDFYFTKGVEAFEKDKFDIAIKWLRKAIETEPEKLLYQCQMSVVYTEIGAYHAANQLLNELLQSAKEPCIDCYYLLANNYAHLGLLDNTKQYAEMYLNNQTNGEFRKDAEHLLDLVHNDNDKNDAEDLETEDKLSIYQEAIFRQMECKEWDKALMLIDEVMSLFPEHKEIEHDYTYALFFSGATEKAIDMELNSLEEHPDSLHSRINLAMFYYEAGKHVAYERQIRELLNVYPIYDQQTFRLAVTFAATGLYEEAYDRFRKLAGREVRNYLVYYKWYSRAAYKLGRPSEALALWEEGCQKHPALAKNEGPWNVT